VVIEAPRTVILGRTRLVLAGFGSKAGLKDTLHIQTINGISSVVLRPPDTTLTASQALQYCAAEQTDDGKWIPTSATITAPECAGIFSPLAPGL
jgi:hypothetical protein